MRDARIRSALRKLCEAFDIGMRISQDEAFKDGRHVGKCYRQSRVDCSDACVAISGHEMGDTDGAGWIQLINLSSSSIVDCTLAQ